jgi:hypothetical protein
MSKAVQDRIDEIPPHPQTKDGSPRMRKMIDHLQHNRDPSSLINISLSKQEGGINQLLAIHSPEKSSQYECCIVDRPSHYSIHRLLGRKYIYQQRSMRGSLIRLLVMTCNERMGLNDS